MPNYCGNNMEVKGNVKNVLTFIKENFRTNKNPYTDKEEYAYILDFEEFLPTPLEEGTDKIIEDWYSWRNQYWGCKWSPNYNQCIVLTLTPKDESESDFTLYDRYGEPSDGYFNEININKLIENHDKYKEADLQCYYETPWSPPGGIINAWHDKYKDTDIEFSCKYYEPGCCFVGEIIFKGEYIKYQDYYVGDDEVAYIQYLLDEGWESLDYYLEELDFEIHDMNKDQELADKIIEKVAEVLMKAENNKQRATLISDIFEKYRNSCDN